MALRDARSARRCGPGLGRRLDAYQRRFSQLQLRSLLATDASKSRHRPGEYLVLRLTASALGLLLIGLFTSLSSYRPDTAAVVLLVGVAKAIESISNLYYGFAQRQEQMPVIGWSMILRGHLSLTALGLVIAVTHSVVWSAAALAGVSGALLLLYDKPRVTSILDLKSR